MLVIQCANGYVGYSFGWASQTQKQALCTEDGTRIIYDPSPGQTWTSTVIAMVTHAIALKGAFQTAYWVGL